MNITPEFLHVLNESFPVFTTKKSKTMPVRIRFCGNFITTCSNKTVWRNIGHAKNAFRHHIESCSSWVKLKDAIGALVGEKKPEYGWYLSKYYKPLIEGLQKQGYLEFVAVDYESFTQLGKSN